MKRIKKLIIEEYKYDNEEERRIHVAEMENNGYECSGQVRKSDDNLMSENKEYYWFGSFSKYE